MNKEQEIKFMKAITWAWRALLVAAVLAGIWGVYVFVQLFAVLGQ